MTEKIDQSEKVDKVVSNTLSEMSYVWDETIDKLKSDGVCFKCGEKLETVEKDGLTEPKINLFKANSTEKGAVAFVCLCDKCVKELQDKEVNE